MVIDKENIVDIEFVNDILKDISEEYHQDYIDILYNDFLEAIYGTDPRWVGSDWDELA